MFRLLDPWLLTALVLAPLTVLAQRWMDKRGRPRIVFSDLSAFQQVPPSNRARLRHSVIALRALTIAVLVIALARPQYGNHEQQILSKGIDIMIVLDVSGSMTSDDMDPTRLGAAKAVAQRFVEEREKGLQNDRIGLVVFSRVAFTQCPLTVDYTILKQIIGRASPARKEFDGTAIGTGLATAVGRLKDSKAKSKVVILVTDGQNNQGIDPMTAASIAQTMKVKVYTIGIVPSGMMRKVQTLFGVTFVPSMPTVDESQMKEIASVTGGKYYRATDADAFKNIFDDIDKLEKTEVKVKEFYRYSEAFGPWAAAALFMLLAELAVGRTVFRSLP